MKVSEELELFVPPSDATVAQLGLLCCLWNLSVETRMCLSYRAPWSGRVTEREAGR